MPNCLLIMLQELGSAKDIVEAWRLFIREEWTVEEGVRDEDLQEKLRKSIYEYRRPRRQKRIKASQLATQVKDEDGALLAIEGHTTFQPSRLPGDLAMEGWEMTAASQNLQSQLIASQHSRPSNVGEQSQPGPSGADAPPAGEQQPGPSGTSVPPAGEQQPGPSGADAPPAGEQQPGASGTSAPPAGEQQLGPSRFHEVQPIFHNIISHTIYNITIWAIKIIC